MREILFRAKRKDNGEWVEGLLLKKKYNTDKLFISCFPDKDDNEEVFVVAPSTVCQFTGLTDKNGTKIFEGDVVRVKGLENDEHWKHYDEIGKVAFVNGVFLIQAPKEYNGMKHYSQIHSYYMTTADWVTREVIGNIFDNKEILQ